MKLTKNLLAFTLALCMTLLSSQQAEAVTYVTDAGGYAYDESRAATNIGPAIGLATVAVVAIVAVAVQNSHGSSSSHSHSYTNSSSSHN